MATEDVDIFRDPVYEKMGLIFDPERNQYYKITDDPKYGRIRSYISPRDQSPVPLLSDARKQADAKEKERLFEEMYEQSSVIQKARLSDIMNKIAQDPDSRFTKPPYVSEEEAALLEPYREGARQTGTSMFDPDDPSAAMMRAEMSLSDSDFDKRMRQRMRGEPLDDLAPMSLEEYERRRKQEVDDFFRANPNAKPKFQSGGAVDDFDIFDYLPSRAQLAYFGGQFLPGAGIADAAGQMPPMPRGDMDLIDAFAEENMPSLGENIERGEYFDAAMQGLGLLGDAMYAVPLIGPVLGPTVGSVAKGVGAGGKAIKRGIEALDPVVDANRAGFETNQIMYHGTSDTFTRFEPSKTGNLGEGIYFTPDPAIASNRAIVSSMKPKRSAGANVMPVYIKRNLNYFDIDYDPLTKIDIPKIKAEGFDGVRRFDKQGNLIESNIFDPDNIRPVFSVDGPATSIKAASKEDLVQNFKQNQAPVGTIDPDTSKAVTESLNRARAKRYTDNLKTPAFKRREEARAAGKIQDLVSAERTILDPNDLYGYSLVPVAGDRSGIGALTEIKGVPLSFPVAVQGGPGYPLYMSGKGKGWASMQGAANQKQMNIIQALDETGMAPLGVYTAMGREGINFSTPVVLSMVGQLDYLKIPKKQIAAFNSAVKKGTPANPGIKDFVGLDSPDLIPQLTGEIGSSVSSGNIRKAVIEEMKKPRWQNMGFPVYEDVLETVTDPALRIPRGPKGTLNPAETGYSIFKGAPSKPTFQDPYHLSYDTVIPGDYLGGLPGRGVPPEIMFPQNFARMARKTNVAGQPLTRQQQLGSLAMEPMVEPVTDELIENLAKYLNKTQGTNFAEGGEVEDPRISRQLGFDENDAKEVAFMNAGIPFDYDRSGVLSLAV